MHVRACHVCVCAHTGGWVDWRNDFWSIRLQDMRRVWSHLSSIERKDSVVRASV
jgi:isoleucyl-tRNA synthetase